ncbi:MAG: hypothetical protein CR986_00250 [Ignavibacteriae bacterium]|nr:MAG: hypothetical protein CR986_00250 [Ignavibacteriota bacterium]
MNKKSKSIIFLLFLVLACEPINDFENDEFSRSILFNLTVNQDKQFIYYYKTIENEKKFHELLDGGVDSSFIKDANISIVSSNSIFDNFIIEKSSAFIDHRFHYTNIESFHPKPDTDYELKIVENGNIITGKTRTPSDFNIIYPKTNSKFSKSNDKFIEVKWGKSKSAFGYLIKTIRSNKNEYSSMFITQDTVFSIDLSSDYRYKKGSKLNIEIYAYVLALRYLNLLLLI